MSVKKILRISFNFTRNFGSTSLHSKVEEQAGAFADVTAYGQSAASVLLNYSVNQNATPVIDQTGSRPRLALALSISNTKRFVQELLLSAVVSSDAIQICMNVELLGVCSAPRFDCYEYTLTELLRFHDELTILSRCCADDPCRWLDPPFTEEFVLKEFVCRDLVGKFWHFPTPSLKQFTLAALRPAVRSIPIARMQKFLSTAACHQVPQELVSVFALWIQKWLELEARVTNKRSFPHIHPADFGPKRKSQKKK